jgi:glycerol-3-phosphate acyltransferase PlsY
MKVWMVLLAAAGGYLIGSLSFARIVTRLVAPGQEHEKLRRAVPDTDDTFEGHTVSAGSVRDQLGARYGCLTALLDASKAAIPALVFRLWQPDGPYYLIAATAAIVGHIYPLYYRFQGGLGVSTMYGGFFVVDWLGTIVTTLAGMAAGILAEHVLIMRWSGRLLMIPWIWFRTHDWQKLAYVVAANILYWTAMIPELRQYFRFRAEDKLPDSAEVADLLGMKGMWQVVRRFSIPSQGARIRASNRGRAARERPTTSKENDP